MSLDGSGRLAGQRALIVGGSSGIGLAAARRIAADGAIVTIAGRTTETLDAAVAAAGDDGIRLVAQQCDAMDAAAVRDAIDAASDDAGRLDIAVVAPGGGSISPVLLFDDERFVVEVERNLVPVFNVLKYAGQAMVRNGSGSFVAISSTAAAFSARFLAAYSAGKAAADQLLRVAANELGEHGIRVNSVRPGMTRTRATAASFANRAMTDAFIHAQPLARSGEVDDIAEAVRYFAGPESSWVTGQCLAVDGGHTLRAFIDYDALLSIPDVRAESTRRNGAS